MHIWNKWCRLIVYCRQLCNSISWGWGMVPKWIGMVAGRVDTPRFCWHDATDGKTMMMMMIIHVTHATCRGVVKFCLSRAQYDKRHATEFLFLFGMRLQFVHAEQASPITTRLWTEVLQGNQRSKVLVSTLCDTEKVSDTAVFCYIAKCPSCSTSGKPSPATKS